MSLEVNWRSAPPHPGLKPSEARLLANIDRPAVDAVTGGEGLYADTTRCAAYRFFHPSGALLYGGIANDPLARFRQHADNGAAWWELWGWNTVRWYPSRTFAVGVEAHLIVAEAPAFNLQGRAELFPVETDADKAVQELADLFRDGGPSLLLLDNLFGVWRRTAGLAGLGGQLEADPDVAHARYLMARGHAGRLVREFHRFHVAAWTRREAQARADRATRLDSEARSEQVREARIPEPSPEPVPDTAKPRAKRARGSKRRSS